MIDTCPALREQAAVAPVEEGLPQSIPLSVFLTRADHEVIGNIRAIHTVRPRQNGNGASPAAYESMELARP